MKAQILDPGGANRYISAELADPKPGPDEVLLRIDAASVNYRDYFIRANPVSSYGGDMRGQVPLSDGVGRVVAMGQGVTRFAIGDRLCPNFFPHWLDGAPTAASLGVALGAQGPGGTAAELLAVPADSCVAAPEHLSDVEAAGLACAGVTAWVSLVEYGALKPGQTVLVQGTGGVSVFALQIAKAMGARVVLISSSDEKIARARALGADDAINYRTTPDWEIAVRDLTGGRGVDHIVEVGGEATLPRSLEALAHGGSIGLIGVLTGFGGEVPYGVIKSKLLHVHGVYVGSSAQFARMNAFLSEHRIKPVVSDVFDLAQADDATTRLSDGKHFGKIAIRVSCQD